MGIFARINDAIKGRSKTTATQEISGQNFCTALCSSYENAFAQVRAVVDELKTVRPYGIGRNGAKLPITRTPELSVLDYPNEEMGWSEFADLMFTTWLTEPELNLHVWKKSNKNVYGYTILPRNSKRSLGNGDYYFEAIGPNNERVELTREEVMTLRFSRSPQNFSKGVSPVSAVEIWSQIDDLIAQYQKAFFENGAVPAYVTIIRARSEETYQAKRRELENGTKGARNRHKTIYIWRHMRDDGLEEDEVEVKTIQGNNATLAIKEIMSVVDNKINKAFGVSNFILGDDASAKYDNAELSDRQFTKRRIYPALVSFWGQFQHELDRILGGLGYAISFDLEIPELTDRLKVKSEISGNNVKNLTDLITAGASPKAAVKALGLGESWLEVAFGLFEQHQDERKALEAETTAPVEGRETPIVEAEVVAETTDHLCTHDHCYHHEQTQDAASDYEPSFSADEVVEKLIYQELMKLVDQAIKEKVGNGFKIDEEDMAKIVKAIYDALLGEAEKGADDGALEIKGYLGGKEADEIAKVLEDGGYKMSAEFAEKLSKRTEKLVSRFDEAVREELTQIFEERKAEAKTKQELAKELKRYMPKFRAETIARNETAYALRGGKLENDKAIAQKYGLKMEKTWRAHLDKKTCAICRSMDGQKTELDSAFRDSVQSTIDGEEDVTYTWEQNSWNEEGQIPSAHVNCRCYFETRVIR